MIAHATKSDKQKVEDASWRMKKSLVARLSTWFIESAGWEKIVIITLVLVIPILLFYNLGLNPRTWHDEGDALALSRTLAEDGVYGVRVSDGYQTFGMVQSIGPTVILPVALAFKTFGIGLIQGRAVAAIYAALTLIIFFWVGKVLIGQRAAIISIIALLSFPGVRYLYTARQVLGLVPALGFFLAGFLIWIEASKSKGYLLAIISGILIGSAILTKSQYLVMSIGALAIISILDLFYYRLGTFKVTIVVILVALACYGAWNLWQWIYYGQAVFLENADKLAQLARVAYGLRPRIVVAGIRVLLGSDTGHYFLFWGFLSLPYIGLYSLRKDVQNMALACLLIFTCLWLGFTVFWSFPWPWHFFAPLSITVLFVGKLYDDLAISIAPWGSKFKQEVVNIIKLRAAISIKTMSTIGPLIALITLALWTGYNFEKVVSLNILDRVGEDLTQWPRSFSLPYQTADFLNQTVEQQSTIETSERELAILTDLNYHSPDQSILIEVIPFAYSHTGTNNYRLGSEYFSKVRPSYLVIGYFAKAHQVYDMDFVLDYYELISIVGTGEFEYEIFRLKKPLPALRTNSIAHLYRVTTAQIHPDLTNGEAVSRYAREAAEIILQDI